jgi:hypothetical protein
MDVLELTAVSAIVLDLLSGFQRPSRYRLTAPSGTGSCTRPVTTSSSLTRKRGLQ